MLHRLVAAAVALCSLPALGLAGTGGAAASPAPTHATATASTRPMPCDTSMPADVRCGELTVPTDWENLSDPRTMRIAYAVHPATGTKWGTITYNPGGPGDSGLDWLPTWLGEGMLGPNGGFPSGILEHFDIVAWDPRGVGDSTPHLQGCDGQATYGPLPQSGPVDWRAAARTFADTISPILQGCLADNPDVAPYLGTYYVIRDLEALRAALDVPQWTYLGTSYGTTVGMAYARQYPDRVRALVLDGVAPPHQSVLQSAASQGWAWSYAVREFVGTYGARFSRTVSRAIRTLDRGGLTNGDDTWTRFPQAPDDFNSLWGTIRSLPSQSGYPGKHAWFARVAAVARTARPIRHLPPSQVPVAMDYIVSFVECADRPDRPTPDAVAAIAEQADAAGIAVAGTHALWRGLWCSGLPPIGHPISTSSAPIALAHHALLVNAVGDPQTPWLRAKLAASTIVGARLISYAGTKHGLYRAAGSTCVDSLVTRYLKSGALPRADVSCPFSTFTILP